ncbi:MAG: DUF4097 family beta strand repeat-containing protein [Bryobacteraceae bacterium]
MKRTSVVAPLLLIGVGVLFLARNMYPDLALVDYFARYWPTLLILWGVLRLAEILFWAATEKELPARGMSGGEWILIVFLCLIGFSVHTVRGFESWWPRSGITMGGIDMFGESFDYPIAGEQQTTKAPRVILESFRGNARITGIDSTSVKVTGRKSIRSLEQSGADNANKDSQFEITGDANQVTIHTNQDHVSGSQRITEEMEITVPKGATVEAHGRTGDFDITDVTGNVEIVSDNAGVRLQNIGGEVKIDLRRSDIVRAVNVKGAFDLKGHGSDVELQDIDGQVTIAGTYAGVIQFRNISKPLRFNGQQTDLNIEKLPGEVRMALGDFTANNLIGPVRLTTRSRDVHISDFTNSLELTVERGDIELRPGKLPIAKMDVHAHFGDVELSLPPAAKFDLTAITARGETDSDFGAPLHTEHNGNGGSIRGSLGGPVINLQTERGKMIVRKATADDKPFTPEVEAPTSSVTPAKPLQKVEQ